MRLCWPICNIQGTVNSVYVVKRVELIRVTQGSNVTLLWEIGDYTSNDRVTVTDPNGQQLFQYIYGNLAFSSGHFIDAGKRKADIWVKQLLTSMFSNAGDIRAVNREQTAIKHHPCSLWYVSYYLSNKYIFTGTYRYIQIIYQQFAVLNNQCCWDYAKLIISRYPRKIQYFCQSKPMWCVLSLPRHNPRFIDRTCSTFGSCTT